MSSIRELLRLAPGTRLADLDPHAKPGFEGGKADGKQALADLGAELAELQERLFAEAYTGGNRRILLVLQGMDTSGKGGVLDHAVGLLHPFGVHLTSFKAPTKEELAHDFLWRIEREVPRPGMVGVFDRSHYEDVLVVRVHGLAEPDEVERRYDAINEFEQRLADDGTTLLKCMLHMSRDEQQERLLARLDDPAKQWKFKPGDVDERALWPAYEEAYEIALERCNTATAPWYVVPSDRKWYRNWAIGRMLLETLRDLDLSWPEPDYDVAEQRRRLLSGQGAAQGTSPGTGQ
jgi:PPK2 family polyphosphate:nucleotide phosphotransferase